MAGDKSDEELMREVARGRADRLELLVRRYAVRLMTFLSRMVGDRHRAEELFQEVFLAIWLKRHQYDPDRAFRPWLYAVAINACRAAFRRRVLPTASLGEVDPADSSEAPGDRICAAETATLVSRAVTLLPEQQRTVVVLRVWEELPYARIAEIVGCTEGTVRSHMHHGLAALRQHLQPLVESNT
jgi:RNA polymerase sigma-70 factor, ECF subfamily